MAAPTVSNARGAVSTREGNQVSISLADAFTDTDKTEFHSYSVVSGLPVGTGLSIDPDSGEISGVPTAADVAAPITVTIRCQSATGSIEFDVQLLTPGPGAADRSPLAGIYQVWYNATSKVNLDHAIVKGGQPNSGIATVVSSGNYAPASGGNYWQVDSTWQWIDDAGDKAGQLQIYGKKSTDWQKHFWYLTSAKTTHGVPKTETGDWIPAWWTAEGVAAMKGIFDLVVHYWDNEITQARKDRTIGIRVGTHAIATEGDNPNTASGKDTANYIKGGSNSSGRPSDYSAALSNQYVAELYEYVLDTAFTNGDANPAKMPLLLRPKVIDASGALQTRAQAMLDANLIGYVITAAQEEPINSVHVDQITDVMNLCKKAGGNTRCFSEPFGKKPEYGDGTFSNLQRVYWTGLETLHAGFTYISFRPMDLGNYVAAPATDLETEWKASFDFIDKYAGYQQFPAASPGGWVAFREGNRFPGNYDFLAEQVVIGGGDVGTPQQAASDYLGAAVGDVGSNGGLTYNDDEAGFGERLALYCRKFAAAETCKVALDAALVAAIDGDNLNVHIHYLDNNAAASFIATIFGVAKASVNVANSGEWKVQSYSIPAAVISADGDGAHVAVAIAGGDLPLHMIEVTT